MPRTAEQNEEIRAATQKNIVDSAMICFAQQGYAHTSIREIARQANISPGLMYHYFEGKEALLRAVFDNCMEIISETVTAVMQRTTPPERLGEMLRQLFALLESKSGFWQLFYMLRTQPAIMEQLGDDFRARTVHLRDFFVADLQIMGHAEPEMGALLLYSLLEGTIQQYLLDPDHYPLEAVTERIIEQFT